jgi:hypothetical protein
MPIYEFKCPKHGIFERIITLDKYKIFYEKGMICKLEAGCLELCERVWSLTAPINIGEATIVYKDRRTGETYIPSSKYEKLNPKRFEKVELKGSIARTKFENQENERNKISDEILTEKYKQQREASVKRRHEELKANLNSNNYFTYVDENTGETKTTSLDSSEKALMKSAMDFTKTKKSRKNLKRKTESKFVVNHTDNSNLNK